MEVVLRAGAPRMNGISFGEYTIKYIQTTLQQQKKNKCDDAIRSRYRYIRAYLMIASILYAVRGLKARRR